MEPHVIMVARTTSAPLPPMPGAVARTGSAVIARTHGLTVRIDGRTVLHEVDLEVPAGIVVGLVGSNGVGKSTLLKVVARLLTPWRGELELFGERLGARESAPAAAIRRRIGVIGHGLMLYRDLTVRENLRFFGRLYGLQDLERRLEEALGSFALAEHADIPVKSLSRGTAQRAAIARALLHGPELLLADEPFTGLDALGTEQLEAAIETVRSRGGAVVLAHHHIDHALRLSDRIVVLNRGRVALDEPTATLTSEDVRIAMRETDA